MQILAKTTLIIPQHEPGNLKRDISPNNAKLHKPEVSILVSTSIVQVTLTTSGQRPEDFCFEIIGMSLSR